MATAADLLALFPQFEDVGSTTIDAWLAEAGNTVDDSWAPDQDRATIYLAAHLMSMAGIGPEKGAAALAGIKTIRSGQLTIEREAPDSMGEYGLTSFGRLYWPIARGTRGGMRVTGTGDYPWPYGAQRPDFPFDVGG